MSLKGSQLAECSSGIEPVDSRACPVPGKSPGFGDSIAVPCV